MPRRSSGGRSARAPARAPTRPKAQSNKAPVNRTPPSAPVRSDSGRSMLGDFASAVVEGVAFSAGNAVAHRVMEAVMGPRTIRHETVPAAAAADASQSVAPSSSKSDACGNHYKAFQDCINSSEYDISKCQFYMDMLSECKKGSGLAV